MEKFIDWLNKKCCCYDSDEDVENEKAIKQTPSSIEEPRGHSIERGSHTVNVSNQNINKGTDSFQARGSRSSSVNDIHERFGPSRSERLNSTNTEYARLQDEIDKLKRAYQRSENELKQSQRELSRLKQNYINEIEELKRSYQLIESENKTLQLELNKLSKLEQNQITEIERLERSCKQIEKKYQEVRHDYSELNRKEQIHCIPGRNTVNASKPIINCETDSFQALGSRSSSVNDILARCGPSRSERLNSTNTEYARLQDEKDKLKRAYQRSENEREQLLLKLEQLQELSSVERNQRIEIEELKRSYQLNESEYKKLQLEFDKLSNIELNQRKTIEDMKRSHQLIENGFQKVQQQQQADLEQKKRLKYDEDNEIKKLKAENESLLLIIQDNGKEYNRKLESHKRQWNPQMSELNVKYESAMTALDEKDKLMNKLRAQDEANQNEMERLNSCLSQKETNIQTLLVEISDLKHKCDNLESERIDNINAIDKLNEQIESKNNLLLSKETEIDNLKQGYETIQSKHSELQACVAQKEQKEVLFPIQIYCAGDTEISLIASELFSEVLQSHMSDLPVHIQQYRNAADIKPNLPTVCLCVNVSRLGTDVMKGMKELEINSNVVVVVLHFKEPHCLPSESSRRILTEKEYKHGLHAGMYDLGFQKHSIYDCPQNNAHWGDIVECLKNMLYINNMITDQ